MSIRSNFYLVAEIVTLNHSEAVQRCAAHREDQPKIFTDKYVYEYVPLRVERELANLNMEKTYEVWIRGRRRTSSLNVYLILRYMSSPRQEKSTAIS